MSGKFLRLEQVMAEVELGRSSIWAKVKEGSFPGPVRQGTRFTRWLSDEVQAWKEERIRERDGDERNAA